MKILYVNSTGRLCQPLNCTLCIEVDNDGTFVLYPIDIDVDSTPSIKLNITNRKRLINALSSSEYLNLEIEGSSIEYSPVSGKLTISACSPADQTKEKGEAIVSVTISLRGTDVDGFITILRKSTL